MEMEEDPLEEPEAPRRSCALLWIVLALCGGCLALGGVFYAFRYEVRRSLVADYDTRLVLMVSGQDFDPEGVADELRARLRRHGILAQVSLERDGIVVLVRSADREWIAPILAGAAEFRVLAEVPPDALPQEGYQAELERIQAAQAGGGWSPSEDTYATYPWHPQAFGAKSGPLLLQTEGMLDAGDFASFEVSQDSNGRPALLFKTTPEGARRLQALSERCLLRRLALVINGEIRSAPVVRSPISKSGIVEGGQAGWTQSEIKALVIQLEASQVPFKLELVKETKLSPQASPQAGGR